MKTLWICLAFAVIGATGTSLNEDLSYEDYWYEDDADNGGLLDEVKEPSKTTVSDENNKDTDIDDFVTSTNFSDYQFEDNRLDLDEDIFDIMKSTSPDSDVDNERSEESLSTLEVKNKETTLKEPVVSSDENGQQLDNPVETPTDNTKTTDGLSNVNDSEKKLVAILSDENDFIVSETAKESISTSSDLKEIYEETSKILDEYDEGFDENVDADSDSVKEIDLKLESNEDTEQKLQETKVDDTIDTLNDLIANLDELKKTRDELESNDNNEFDKSEFFESDEEDYEEIDDSNFEQLFEKNVEKLNNSDSLEKFSMEQATEKISEPRLYLNDALVDSDNKNNSNSTFSSESKEVVNDSTANIVNAEQSIDKVDKSSEDFTAQYSKNIEVTSDDARKATNIRLTVDNPVVVTSEDYPEPYPVDTVTDWMFTGDGMGIELIITNFSINGYIGDYLLVKPGGVDDSGSTGLLFSYSLRSERRYRFIDVDQMFVRFEAKQGMQFYRGFSFSVRMIVPRSGIPVKDSEPEEEAPERTVLTISLNLGGLAPDQFLLIEDDFLKIIADMATAYIVANDIDPGMNTTLETAQITTRAYCSPNWPKFERCVEVTFGVPLIYNDTTDQRLNETDLTKMWRTYYEREPFAERFMQLGITEYQVPNDAKILTLWLLIASGVVICMALLGFVLWRYSCFAEYTRMPSFSDTDSVNEKRKLDLYPTPHQTLPPLYSEIDYQWADAKFEDTTKVDLGGFTNKSYMQNDLFDIDSDEDAIPVRERSSSFNPRDIYSV